MDFQTKFDGYMMDYSHVNSEKGITELFPSARGTTVVHSGHNCKIFNGQTVRNWITTKT